MKTNTRIEDIQAAIDAEGRASVIGFGTFKIVKRGARRVRNIATGEIMQVPDRVTVSFKPSKSLIARLNDD